jgi:hypothetical protein
MEELKLEVRKLERRDTKEGPCPCGGNVEAHCNNLVRDMLKIVQDMLKNCIPC